MPYEYDNDNDIATRETKSDGNMTNELKEVGTKDKVPYKRDDNMMTKVKWSIQTSDVDNDFMREYGNMHKSMEDRQINDFYEARRHIQSAMMGVTPVKTGQNRQCIDNVSDYDREHHRIFKSVHHRLDKEAKRFAIEKAQIEALIEKHRPHTPKTPDEVSTSGTDKNAKVDGQEGTEKGKPQQ